MAEVIGLDGKQIEGELPSKTPLAVLKQVVAKIETGDLVLEEIYIIGIKPSKTNSANIIQESWDSGMTAASAVYVLESHKLEIIQMMRDI